MDAGRAYNDFPYMAGQWIPDEYWAIKGWRGFFENTAAVQLHHRLLAGTTLVSVLTTWAMFRGRGLPQASHQLLSALAAMTAVQVSLMLLQLMYMPLRLSTFASVFFVCQLCAELSLPACDTVKKHEDGFRACASNVSRHSTQHLRAEL